MLRPLCLSALLLSACTQQAPSTASGESSSTAKTDKAVKKSQPSRWANALTHQAKWSDDQAMVVVEVVVQPGFHVYTKGETTGRPISVSVDGASGYEIAGEVVHPAGITKKLEIGTSVIVEGSAELKAPVKKVRADAAKLKGVFGYQVCTDSACDRPRKVPFTLNAPKPES